MTDLWSSNSVLLILSCGLGVAEEKATNFGSSSSLFAPLNLKYPFHLVGLFLPP